MRPRNAAGTREAILDAARVAFTHHCYEAIGVREITSAAGVNASLINRYFGTKERLFAEVMQAGLGFDAFDGRTFEQVVGALADRALQRGGTHRSEFDPILALIRSAPVESAQPILRDLLTREAVTPLANMIGGNRADERASLIVAVLIGIIILRAVIKSEPLASSTRNDLATLIEQTVRSIALAD